MRLTGLTGLTLPILLGALLHQVVTVEKPGVCPTCLNPCSGVLKMDCDSDDNCNGTQKCCEDGCVYSCKDPAVTKPGKCPNPPTPATACPTVIPMEDRHCTGDQDCDGAQKCCKDGCGFSCMNPNGSKPGLCPACLHPCKKSFSTECDSDEKCNGTQKCCQDGCQYLCTDPVVTKPGECPVYTKPCSGPPVGPVCNCDEDCDGLQKCCKDGNYSTCTEPVVIKPGVCRISSIPDVFCHDVLSRENCNCNGDQNCTGKEKCCLFRCHYECLAPAVMKPGDCPAPETPFVNCERMMFVGGCGSDMQCEGTQKCCKEGCGHQCKEPVGTPGRNEN